MGKPGAKGLTLLNVLQLPLTLTPDLTTVGRVEALRARGAAARGARALW